MKKTTITAIQAILATDPIQNADDRKQLAIALGFQKDTLGVRPGTVKQAAEILDCNPRTIQRYERMGLLSAIRISARKICYDLNEVTRLAECGRMTTEALDAV